MILTLSSLLPFKQCKAIRATNGKKQLHSVSSIIQQRQLMEQKVQNNAEITADDQVLPVSDDRY